MSVPSLQAIADTVNSAVLRLRGYSDNPDLQQLADALGDASGHLIRHANTRPVRADALLCTECYSEVHYGKRETANAAILVAAGNGACAEHIYFAAPTPQLPDRTASGIIIPGANGSGG